MADAAIHSQTRTYRDSDVVDHPDLVTAVAPRMLRRVSWGALFAGTVVAVLIQMLFALLGFAIGMHSIEPQATNSVPNDLGVSAGIWWLITGLISLFAGGWAAGRLAGSPVRLDGALHGLVSWGLATLLTVYLATTAVGGVLSGAWSVMVSGVDYASQGAYYAGQGAYQGGQGVAAVVDEDDERSVEPTRGQPNNTAALWSADPNVKVNWQEVEAEIREILRETDTRALRPEQLEQMGEKAVRKLREGANESVAELNTEEFVSAVYSVSTMAENRFEEVDKDALANVLADRTDLTKAEARQRVNEWIDDLQQTWANAKETAREAYAEVEDDVIYATDQALDTAANASLWLFFTMLLGAGAASVGGLIGAPQHLPLSEIDTDEALRKSAE